MNLFDLLHKTEKLQRFSAKTANRRTLSEKRTKNREKTKNLVIKGQNRKTANKQTPLIVGEVECLSLSVYVCASVSMCCRWTSGFGLRYLLQRMKCQSR